MQVSGLLPDVFRYRREKGYEIVIDFLFDLVDAVNVEAGLFLYDSERGLGNSLETGHSPRRLNLDFEPRSELGLLGPERSHFRESVAFNHNTMSISPSSSNRLPISAATVEQPGNR